MVIKQYSRQTAKTVMESYSSNQLPPLDEVYMGIRTDLENLFSEIERENITGEYEIDVHYGLKLYDYLSQKGFNNRGASDDGFWRYLSVAVIPHIVEKRWSREQVEHFWNHTTRIWLSSIWWYVYLSWQGSIEATKETLLKPGFSTDTIMNLVERTGRDGTYVNVYRTIMKYQSQVKSDNANIFRAIMKLNTAKLMVIAPQLCPDKIDGYVKSIYAEKDILF